MKQYSTTAIEMKYSYSSTHFYTHTRVHISILVFVLMKQYSTTAIEMKHSYSSVHFYTRTHETVLNYSYRDEVLILKYTFLYSYSYS